MNTKKIMAGVLMLSAAGLSTGIKAQNADKPNIIYILADDLGYGDVSALNVNSKIKTPNIDRLASEGITFTDAHTNSAVCTPTRYGILTGRYAWRSRLKNGVLGGYDDALIEEGRKTVADICKQAGYQTAIVGKWHLGLNWKRNSNEKEDINWNAKLKRTPTANGFDYSYIIPASLDMPPYVYVENDRVEQIPTDTIAGRNGKAFYRRGICANDFEHDEVLEHFTYKAQDYISRAVQKDDPFFLYFPLPAPHTPILPTKRWQGKSNTTAYGDFVLMVDWVVKEIMETLEQYNIVENTMIVFTSDNGCSPMANFTELAQLGHDPSYIYRGHKADIYEGGHRIPYLVRWPEKVKANRKTDEVICTTDMLATVAAITGSKIDKNTGEDSFNTLPVLLGESYSTPIRPSIIHHSVNGTFSIRKGDYKLVSASNSGGWSYPAPGQKLNLPKIQLYNMKRDVEESMNVEQAYPKKVKVLLNELKQIIESGASR